MTIDKIYCMSSFLALRYVSRPNVAWAKRWLPCCVRRDSSQLIPVTSSQEMNAAFQQEVGNLPDGSVGILLSGGMDSAILASYLPKGAKAYTLRSVADGAVNEVDQARFYAERCGLSLSVVDVTWQDYLDMMPELMKAKRSPFHSIEPLILKAMQTAKQDGVTHLICGDNADTVFGGMDGLLSKDWQFDEFVARYNYTHPETILIQSVDISDAYVPYRNGEEVDAYGFISTVFAEESLNSYINASVVAGIQLVAPFSRLKMGCPLNLARIRAGESKYLIRDLFSMRYPGLEPNPKLPMPRAVRIWLKDWPGPDRPEFRPNCIDGLKPDQKWLVFCLERFLNLLDEDSLA